MTPALVPEVFFSAVKLAHATIQLRSLAGPTTGESGVRVMSRDDWRQSVPDGETFEQLFERAKRKSEVPAAPRFGIGAVRVAPRPTPRSAPRPQARVVINAELKPGAPDEKSAEGPKAAPPAVIRFGAPPVLPAGIESFADLLDDDPPRPKKKGPGAKPPVAPPVAPRFAAPPLAAAPPVVTPPAAVRFGPPPPEPARPRVDTLPPPRRPLVTLPFLQKRSLTTGGSIAVSALTASLVVGAAFGVHAWRTSPPPSAPATYTTLAALAPAPSPPAPASAATSSAVAEAAPKSTATKPPSAAAPEASPASELPPGYGRLTVQSGRDADVYLTGKRAGPANAPLDVRCGTWFVRLARPGEDFPPEWVGAGETVRVACQAATTVELGPGQSSLLLKRSPR